MPKLIDAESTQNRIYVSDYVAEQMKKIPTVDAVIVVRCKDCCRVRGFDGIGIEPDEVGICTVMEMCVKPDDFCSYGERKNNGETD